MLFERINSIRKYFSRLSFPGGMKTWITLLCLSFIIVSLLNNSSQLGEISISKRIVKSLILAIFITYLSLIVNAYSWKVLIKWLGYNYPDKDIVNLFLTSNLLKYLPGGIWHFVERIRFLRLELGGGNAFFAVFYEPVVMLCAALLWVPLGGWQSGFSLLCILPPFFLSSRWREPIHRKLREFKLHQLIKVDKELFPSSSNFEPTRSVGKYPFVPLVCEMGFVLCRFGGFLCCLNAFSLVENLPLGQWLAAFSLAWTIGLVVPAAPGGLGVFEAAMFLRVGSSVAETPLLAAIVSYRIVSSISDVLASALSSRNIQESLKSKMIFIRFVLLRISRKCFQNR